MSVAQSIFEKICPSCASILSVARDRCDCGHVFSQHTSELSENTLEASLREEELYENYLAARAAQAQEAARAATTELALSPDDAAKAERAELTKEVAKSLEADLHEQRAKILALQEAMPKPPVSLTEPVADAVPPEVTMPRPISAKPDAVPTPQPEISTIPLAVSETIPADHTKTTSAKPEPNDAERSHVVRTESAKKTVAKKEKSAKAASPVISAARAASVLESIKQAKAREHAARTPPPPPPVAPEPPQEVTVTPVMAVPPAFRAEQAARAEQAVAHLHSLDEKSCPNCTGSVPKNTSRCRCGYTFMDITNDMPTLTLCTGDFTALRDSLNLNLRRG